MYTHVRRSGQTDLGVKVSGATGVTSLDGITTDGRFVLFESTAPGIVPEDIDTAQDVFIYDRQTGGRRRVSVPSRGLSANGWSGLAAVSGDGQYVAFVSVASNLVGVYLPG